jgi:hypothetical protein
VCFSDETHFGRNYFHSLHFTNIFLAITTLMKRETLRTTHGAVCDATARRVRCYKANGRQTHFLPLR